MERANRRAAVAEELVSLLAATVVGSGAAAVLVGPNLEVTWFTIAPIVAVLCTWATVRGALRRERQWVPWLFLGCFLPPTAWFLPTGIGALIGAMAGLVAFFALWPLVYWLRAQRASHRRWYVLAAWASMAALAFVAVSHDLARWALVAGACAAVALCIGIASATEPAEREVSG